MITFFGNPSQKVFAVQSKETISNDSITKLKWLFGDVQRITSQEIQGGYIGPRAAMVTPWSTNAVEITQNMGIEGIVRIEEFVNSSDENKDYDPMLQSKFDVLSQNIFTIEIEPVSYTHLTLPTN